MSQFRVVTSLTFLGRGCDLVDGRERVERAGVADERQEHRDNADPQVPAYKYLQTPPHLASGDHSTFWVT